MTQLVQAISSALEAQASQDTSQQDNPLKKLIQSIKDYINTPNDNSDSSSTAASSVSN
jgi:predicted membrane GTPase involved in stress response